MLFKRTVLFLQRSYRKYTRLFIIIIIVATIIIYHILQIDSVKVGKAKIYNNLSKKVSTLVNERFKSADRLISFGSLGKDKEDVSLFEELVQKPDGGKSNTDIGKTEEVRGGVRKRTDRGEKEKAALLVIIQSREEVSLLLSTVKNYQDQFNDKFNYDWVVISSRGFASELSEDLVALTNSGSTVRFIDLKYNSEVLDYRPNTDKDRVRENRRHNKFPKRHRIKNSVLSRHFTRFSLGHFYNLESLWSIYDYYWKIPIGSRLDCEVSYDVFKHMRENNIQYGWSLIEQDPEQFHPSLLDYVKSYVHDPQNNYMPESTITKNNFHFLLDDLTSALADKQTDIKWKYKSCSINSDFEIVNVNFFRSKQYQHFFNYLDQINGIYYETWREPAIKTIATSLFLDSSSVKFFDDLAVSISLQGLGNCPVNVDFYINNKCTCNPNEHGKSYNNGRVGAYHYDVMSQSKCFNHWLKSLNKEIPEAFKLNESQKSFFDFFPIENH